MALDDVHTDDTDDSEDERSITRSEAIASDGASALRWLGGGDAPPSAAESSIGCVAESIAEAEKITEKIADNL